MSSCDEESRKKKEEEEWRKFKHLNTRDEQFWFTLTALTVNGFAISSLSFSPIFVRIGVTLVSLYAIFLIVHRSADYVLGIIVYPEVKETPKERERSWRYKWQQTKVHLAVFFPHLRWVICEFSGSFFYVLLLLLSLLAVWLPHKAAAPDTQASSCSRCL